MRMSQWELPQYEHIQDNMNISVALLLGWPTRDKIAVLWLGWAIDQVSDRIQGDWSIFPSQTCAGVCLHYCVRPLYSSRLPLSLIGGKWGESGSQHTLEYIWYTHQQEGEHGSWNSISLTKWTLQRRFRSVTKKKSTTVEADTKPASSLSNGIDNVPRDFHLNTFLTHRKKMQLSKSN